MFCWLLICVDPASEQVSPGSRRLWYDDWIEHDSLSGVSGDDSVGDYGSLSAYSVIYLILIDVQSWERILGFFDLLVTIVWELTDGAESGWYYTFDWLDYFFLSSSRWIYSISPIIFSIDFRTEQASALSSFPL